MKIAFFSPSWPPEQAQNGIATYTDILTRALTKLGHECVIITPDLIDGAKGPLACYTATPRHYTGAKALLKKIETRRGSQKDFVLREYTLGIADALDKAQADGPIDIFEIEETHGRSFLLRDWIDIPMVVRCHGPHFLVHQEKFNRSDEARIRQEGNAIADADGLTCPSDALLARVEEKYPNTTALTTAFANPIDLPAEQDCWRLENCDPNLIAFAGRFDLIKGGDIVLQAFNILAKDRPNLKLIFMGDDSGIPSGSGGLVKLPEYIQTHFDSHIQARIDFTGRIGRSEVAANRKRALVSVMTSRFENFAYSMSEALSSGCPLATTQTLGLDRLLENEKDLMIAQDCTPDAVANAVAPLIDSPKRAASLGAAGRQAVARILSPESIAKQSIEFYKSVLSKRASQDKIILERG